LGRFGQRLGQFLSLPLIAVELPVNAPLRIEHHGAKIVDKTPALIGKSKVELRDHGSHHIRRRGREEPAVGALIKSQGRISFVNTAEIDWICAAANLPM
jgi:hypothetical protein